jgi:hypothetical protein
MSLESVAAQKAYRQRRLDVIEHNRKFDEARRQEAESGTAEAIRRQETLPLSEAKARLDQNFRELVKSLRESALVAPEDEDIRDPDTSYTTEYDRYNQVAFEGFLRMHGEGSEHPYYGCPENADALDRYFKANDVTGSISTQMFSRAFSKLHVLGLLRDKPAPAPVYVAPEPVDDGEWGTDWATGEQVHKTAREITLMSAETYKAFARPKVNPRDLFVQP